MIFLWNQNPINGLDLDARALNIDQVHLKQTAAILKPFEKCLFSEFSWKI